MVTVAAKGDCDGVYRLPDEDLRTGDFLGTALPGDREDERSEDHKPEDYDRIEDDAFLEIRRAAAEGRTLCGVLALYRLDGGDLLFLLRILRRKLLLQRIVVDHTILLSKYYTTIRRLSHITR